MNRAKRTQTESLHVQLLREGILESVHQVQAVVCDPKGRVLMSAGDPETEAFIRSALKPFQALATINAGTLDLFGLNDRDLAIICSSHQCSVEQARQAFNILWHCDVDPSALQCPIPLGKRSPLRAQLLRQTFRNAGNLPTAGLALDRLHPQKASPTTAHFNQGGGTLTDSPR